MPHKTIYEKELGQLSQKELLSRLFELNQFKRNVQENNLDLSIDIVRDPNNTYRLVATT